MTEPDLEKHLGEILALATAVTWAFAVILFKKSGEHTHPLGLNLFKNLLAVVLLVPTIWVAGETLFYPAPAEHYLLLLLSGALGIGLADTLFFKSLNVLGAGLSAIVDCLYSPFIISLSMLWLGENLSLWQIVGSLMIVSAVLTAAKERNQRPAEKRMIGFGFLWGALAMATMAVGIVMAKPILDEAPLFWVTEVRLVGGVIVILLALRFHRRRKEIVQSLVGAGHRFYTISGSLMGGYVSMILWLAGMKYTQASTAAALNQTSNLFIFIFAAMFLKEPITRLRTLGIILGVSGAILVTFG